MGDILGSLFGAGADIYGANQAAKAALTGFNWLKNNPTEGQYVRNGGAANNALASLLLGTGNTAGANNGFQNYLNSTGYKFQMKAGQDAITGSNAAKGLLNSGATGKALTAFGQGLAGTTFGNYLNELSGLSSGGQTALGQIGSAGAAGGSAAANALYHGYNDASNSIGNVGTDIGNWLAAL